MLKDTQRKAAMYGMQPPGQPYPNVVATLPSRPAQRPAPPSGPQYATGPSHPAPPGQFAQQYYGRPNDPSRPPQVVRPGHDDGQGEKTRRFFIFCLVCIHRVFLSRLSQGTVCLFVDTTTAPTPRPAGSRPRPAPATLSRALHRRTTSSTRSTLKPAARPNPFLPRKGTTLHTPRARCPHHRPHTSSILPPACLHPRRARGT